ncbi:MAG: hypothetical protein ACKVOK_07220 [Flavobacteriales bacterium]
MKLALVSAIFFFGFFHASWSQQKFVQFIVMGLNTEQQCREIEAHIRTHPGFGSVRAEAHTSNVLFFFDVEQNYTEADFKTWLSELGFDFYCFRAGIPGVDRVVRLTPELCEKMSLRQNE